MKLFLNCANSTTSQNTKLMTTNIPRFKYVLWNINRKSYALYRMMTYSFIHSFILFSSRLRAHAHKKIKQYKPVKKKRKEKQKR